MHVRLWGATFAVVLWLTAATLARAENLVETWRSPFGRPLSVSVDQTDGSCWAAVGARVIHLSSSHTVLGEMTLPVTPNTVLAEPTAGTCWVTTLSSGYFSLDGSSQVVEVSSDCHTTSARVGGLDYPTAVAVDPARDAIWVAFTDWDSWPGMLARISPDPGGGTHWEYWYFDDEPPSSLSLNPNTGSCWVAHPTGGVSRADPGPGGIATPYSGTAVSVDPNDGSCWIADPAGNQVIHVDGNGAELWRGTLVTTPRSVSVNPADRSCWVGAEGALVHLNRYGTVLQEIVGTCCAISVAASSRDGSCWVAESPDAGEVRIAHYASSGTQLWAGRGFSLPVSVSVRTSDDSCWVADVGTAEVTHLASNGAELWRGGGLRLPFSVAVNSVDGSCWVTVDGEYAPGRLSRFTADGTEVLRWRGAIKPVSISLCGDGSCWVGDLIGSVARVSAAGAPLARSWDIPHPWSVSADASNGCWVADPESNLVAHLSSTGAMLWSGPFVGPGAVAVNRADGSCWVAETGSGDVVHISSAGAELCRSAGFTTPGWLVVDASGRCWVVDWGTSGTSGCVALLAANGTELWRRSYAFPAAVACCPDGSAWFTDHSTGELIHLSATGQELLRVPGFLGPVGVGVNATNQSVWVADYIGSELVHTSVAGAVLWRGGGLTYPLSVSVNASDGSCWVADHGIGVSHLSSAGARLWQGMLAEWPESVSVLPGDGSCWVASSSGVVHLSAVGGEEARVSALGGAGCVSGDTNDRSCWVTRDNEVIHLAANGTQLWRGSNFTYPRAVSVDAADSSCWVANTGAPWYEVVHLAAGGTELLRAQQQMVRGGEALSVCADPSDGSCWMGAESDWPEMNSVMHLSSEGARLSHSPCLSESSLFGYDGVAFSEPTSLSLNPSNGSCWVTSVWHGQVARLSLVRKFVADFTATPREGVFPLTVNFADLSQGPVAWWQWEFGDGGTTGVPGPSHTYEEMGLYTVSLTVGDSEDSHTATKQDYIAVYRFADVPLDYWSFNYIEACVGAGIVGGYPDGTYHPEGTVTRDAMAVYIARALAGGDGGVPPGPGTPSFSDVASSYWAYKYIEYAVDNGVVGGYGDGTYRPDLEVNRGAMAVFIARAMAGGDAGVPTGPATATFPDVPIDYWSYKYVEYCKANTVVGGYWDGTYRPEEVVNRGAMAVYVQRAFDLPM